MVGAGVPVTRHVLGRVVLIVALVVLGAIVVRTWSLAANPVVHAAAVSHLAVDQAVGGDEVQTGHGHEQPGVGLHVLGARAAVLTVGILLSGARRLLRCLSVVR
jgi:hypothetical protein